MMNKKARKIVALIFRSRDLRHDQYIIASAIGCTSMQCRIGDWVLVNAMHTDRIGVRNSPPCIVAVALPVQSALAVLAIAAAERRSARVDRY